MHDSVCIHYVHTYNVAPRVTHFSSFINPRCASARKRRRVTVLVLCVCVCVCVSVCVCLSVTSANITHFYALNKVCRGLS